MTAGTSSIRATKNRPWHLYILGLAVVGVVLLATTQLGTTTTTTRTSRQVVTVQKGVVQASTSGSGNIAAGTDVDVDFNTSGTLSKVYVKLGQHVHKGQLLATLDRAAARLTLKQDRKTLQSARDQLATDKSNYSSSSNTSLETTGSGNTEFVSDSLPQSDTTAATSDTTTTTTTVTVTSPSTSTSTTPATTTSTPATTTSTPATTTSTPATTSSTTSSTAAASGSAGSASSGSSASSGTTVTKATIASDEATIYSDRANVRTAQISLAATRLRAPTSGTIVSLESLSPGDAVSSGSSSSTTSTGSSSSGSSSSGTSTTSSGSLGGSSSSSSSSSSSTTFAEIVNTHTLTMTVAFSESDISKIKIGQAATVTLDAISGLELGAHVTAISTVGTTSNSVVSYDATLTLDQHDSRVKPGMSASGAVITGQAYGLNVANSAVSGTGSLATVSLLRDGKTVQQQVVVGLKGDSRTQILSGLHVGDQLVVTTSLPSTGSSSSSSSSTGGSSSGTLSGSTGGASGGFSGGGGFSGSGPPGA
jgi:macrolide-specific efflux system membrane fusion protein